MTTPHPHDRPVSAHWPTDDATTDTFTVRLPRWPTLLGLLGRDPLIRTSDRIEALALALAVVISLLAVPIAAAVGTEIHDSRRLVYADQIHTHHTVTATISADNSAQQDWPINTVTVTARWSANGTEHTDEAKATSTAKTGDPIKIWVDKNGAQAPVPTPTAFAAVEAVTGALIIWICVAAAAATLFYITRAMCHRVRLTGWQHDLDRLVGHGDGHTTSKP
jgi:beta-lactamase regulating signal transducer with metallopeptidase domain